MNAICAEKLDSVVSALCPEIWNNMQSISESDHSEDELWEELVCCILSSQVTFELSRAVTQNIKSHGLLDLKGFNYSYEERLSEVLKFSVNVNGRAIRYRFPNTKAKQIAAAKKCIYERGINLREMLNEYSTAVELRTSLVNLVPGLGMKQASMYLRNIANSVELAIIDSHILRYMKILDLIKKIPVTVTTTQYFAKENLLRKYAEKFAYPVGCVDYAIWIVMRVVRKDGLL